MALKDARFYFIRLFISLSYIVIRCFMCELFALSSSSAAEVSFSLNEFSKHGGLTNHHRHGWGIAYYEKNSARIIKEASSASDSACLYFVKNYSIRSNIVMSHIRYATRGEVCYRNTQPFSRELAAREHVFIHNGDLDSLINNPRYYNRRFNPMGETDSEVAFCYLMSKMAKLWDGPQTPSLNERYRVFVEFAEEMRGLGIANFIYSDCEYVYIYSHKRIVKDGQKQTVKLPGLHVLIRHCHTDIFDTTIKGLQITKSQAQDVVLVSSVALNDENWIALSSQESMVLKEGKIVIGL